MVAILRAWHVDVLHITVGYSPADTGTEMPWARYNVFIFTVTSRPSDDPRVSLRETPVWSRELAVAATAVGGSFDLPSNVRYVTADDIAAAYPGTSDFIAHKMLIDNKMRLHDLLLDNWRAATLPDICRVADRERFGSETNPCNSLAVCSSQSARHSERSEESSLRRSSGKILRAALRMTVVWLVQTAEVLRILLL